MFNRSFRLGALPLIAGLGLAFSSSTPVDAATVQQGLYNFEIYFEQFIPGTYVFYYGYIDGTVSAFSDGTGSGSFSGDLRPDGPADDISLSGNLSYTLQPVSGFYQLVGVYGSDEDAYTASDCSGPSCYLTDGILSIFFNGNQYRFYNRYTTTFYEDGLVVDQITGEGDVQTGTITFIQTQPLPVEAIPEPLTILGVSTAISFGTLFKRKIQSRPRD